MDWLKGDFGRRTKEITDAEDMVEEEDDDNDTDFETQRRKQSKRRNT